MSEVKWIKLSTSMFEDEKIRLIESMPEADTLLIIWIRLLAQAGKTNASGYIFLSKIFLTQMKCLQRYLTGQLQQ